MTRIFISYHNGLQPPCRTNVPVFYDMLVNSLTRHGNSVMIMNSNEFMNPFPAESNPLLKHLNKGKLLSAVRDFSPELLMVFNGSIPSDLLTSCLCPVLVWEADSVTYFTNKAILRDMADHVFFGAVSHESMKELSDAFSISSNNIAFLPFATDLRARNIPQDKNIAFIGSFFGGGGLLREPVFIKNIENRKTVVEILHKIELNPFLDLSKEHIEDQELSHKLKILYSKGALHHIVSTSNRVGVLNDLSDLGLSLFGTPGWINTIDYSHELALCYDQTPVFNALQNEEIYNSTKLCINISHAQTTSALSWRIRDIMATNGCLVSDRRSDFSIFGPDVEVPVFSNRFEARRLCQKLLEDESHRLAIVQACQGAIERGHRFEHRFDQIRDFMGISLNGEGQGSVEFLDPDDYLVGPIRREVIRVEKEACRARRKVMKWLHSLGA